MPRPHLIFPSYRISSISSSRSCKSMRLPVAPTTSNVPSRENLPLLTSPLLLVCARKLDQLQSDTSLLKRDVLETSLVPVYALDKLRHQRKENACQRLQIKDSVHINCPAKTSAHRHLGLGGINSGLHVEFRSNRRINVNGEVDLPTSAQLDEMMLHFEEQAPNFFVPGWTYAKCSYKIEFQNRVLGTCTHTLNSYIFQVNVMRKISRLLLVGPELSIVQLSKNVDDGTIHVRWQLQGLPRYLIPFKLVGVLQNERYFTKYIDGFSIFHISSDGLYHKHILSKMVPRKSPERRSIAAMLLSKFGVVSQLGGEIHKEPVFPSIK